MTPQPENWSNYASDMVADWPDLTGEQIETISVALDPPRSATITTIRPSRPLAQERGRDVA